MTNDVLLIDDSDVTKDYNSMVGAYDDKLLN